MAREQSPREDLLREATALTIRAEIQLAGLAETSVIGFRPNGCLSYYRKADQAYHFNSDFALRRAHIGDELLKAEAGRCVGLTRKRQDGQVAMVRRELDTAETNALLGDILAHLRELQSQLADESAVVVAAVDLPERRAIDALENWLDSITEPITIADVPNVA